MTGVPAVDFDRVTVRFRPPGRDGGTVMALEEVSFALEPGRVFGFIGPNGAGKTTAIQCMLGFLAPKSGAVRLFGEDARTSPARARLGYQPESAAFYPHLTGRELLRFFGRLFGLPSAECDRRAARLLEETGLAHAADRRMGGYSRGMLQRIGLAQALVNEPQLVILDEPASGMDPLGRMDVRALIARLKAAGRTVLFSSHELSEVERICDEVALLCAGRIVARGPPESLTRPGESLEQYFLRMVGGRGGEVRS